MVTHEYINEIFSQIDENESINETIELLAKREEETLRKLGKSMKGGKNILEFEATDVQELYLTTLTQMFDPHTSFLNIKGKKSLIRQCTMNLSGLGLF